ncbi:MAG: T9SS type A sorting domain-containing protein [Prolixibacteraceae bacterium]|nr:T9SS type A sorting domain-containing protein [Prolixibacteraceae bacterium]
MKNFTLQFLIIIAVVLLSFRVLAQEGTTYTDDFSVVNDYLTTPKNGIWEGVLLNSNVWTVDVTAEITVLNTKDNAGALSFATKNSNWAVGNDNGAALYRTVKNGADFEAQVKIAGGDFISFGAERHDYMMTGLIARVKGDSTFILVQAFDVVDWSAVIGVRDIVPAEGLLQENWLFDGLTIADFPYQKLEKYGNAITGYYSADGVMWNEIYSVEKPEFANKDIQVGIYHATYTENEGMAIFDDFSMVDYNEPSSSSTIKKSNNIKAIYSNGEILLNNIANRKISNVCLYGLDGALKYKNSNINSSSYSIQVMDRGMYVVVAESEGKTYSQKIAVY